MRTILQLFQRSTTNPNDFGKVQAILKRTPLFQSSTTNPKYFGKVLMRTPSKRIPRNLEKFKHATQVVSISFQGELRKIGRARWRVRERCKSTHDLKAKPT